MVQYIAVVLFLILAFAGMLAALHFSQYKKSSSGCCGGGRCTPDGKTQHHGCYDEKVDFVDKYRSGKQLHKTNQIPPELDRSV